MKAFAAIAAAIFALAGFSAAAASPWGPPAERTDSATGNFDGIEFKNSLIAQKDIEQLQEYIDYMGSAQG